MLVDELWFRRLEEKDTDEALRVGILSASGYCVWWSVTVAAQPLAASGGVGEL